MIRLATKKDFNVLVKLCLEFEQFESSLDENLVFDQNKQLRIKEEITKVFQKSKNGVSSWYLVAESDKEIVGFSTVSVHKAIPNTGSISQLYVVPKARSAGIGKELVLASIKLLKKHSSEIKNVRLNVNKNNIVALKFYKYLNFSEVKSDYLILETNMVDSQQSNRRVI